MTEEPTATEKKRRDSLVSALGRQSLLPHFSAFWALYPRKEAKLAAARVYAVRVGEEENDPAEVLEALKKWCRHWKRARTERQFIPHPRTWLCQGRFLDPPPGDDADEPVAPQVNVPPAPEQEKWREEFRRHKQRVLEERARLAALEEDW